MNDNPFRNIPFEAPEPGTYDAIFRALEACSLDLIGPMQPRLLVIPLRDDTGAVAGGFWGCTLFGWLHVQLLFIPEPLRGRGIGATLLTLAENEARNRGCVGAHVTSFSFQAAPFYQKLGYTPFGRLDDYPPGHHMLYLGKRLDEPSCVASGPEIAWRRAHALAARGEDAAAKQAYLDVLRIDPTHFAALNELAALAVASGHRQAARTAYAQLVRCHPTNPIGRINLGNLLFEDGDLAEARSQFQAALAVDATCPEAHQGLARVLSEFGDAAADQHRRVGFTGHTIVTKPYRGRGRGSRLLLLVASNGGNIPTRHWIDDRCFAVTVLHADFHDPAEAPPPHDLVVNAIGDADLCQAALVCADALLRRGAVPVINPPARVLATGRIANARRLAGIADLLVPSIAARTRTALLAGDTPALPFLLRAPGFHTGRHFHFIATDDDLTRALAAIPGETLLTIEYLDARGPDGMARKYRAMCIDGALYPAHLAISADWKVHYITAAMATNPAYREEERRFLDDMPGVLGDRAMAVLTVIARTLDLDYAGIDFALTPDGAVLLFEANATMVLNPPGPEPIWDYRRRASADLLAAARGMLTRRIGRS